MAMNMMENTPDAGGNEAKPATPGYLICVHVAGDGQISVGVEPDQEEASEEMSGGMKGGMGEMSGGEMEMDYKPAASIDEALSMARDIYRNNGKTPETDETGMAQARAGYNKMASGRNRMEAPGGMFGE